MNLKTKQTKIRQNYNAIELMRFLYIISIDEFNMSREEYEI